MTQPNQSTVVVCMHRYLDDRLAKPETLEASPGEGDRSRRINVNIGSFNPDSVAIRQTKYAQGVRINIHDLRKPTRHCSRVGQESKHRRWRGTNPNLTSNRGFNLNRDVGGLSICNNATCLFSNIHRANSEFSPTFRSENGRRVVDT